MTSGMSQKDIVHMMVTGIHSHLMEEITAGFIMLICLTSAELKFRKMDLHGMNLQRHVKTLMEHKDELGIEYPTIINDMSSAIDTMYPWIQRLVEAT